jgi:hypothetical protein
MARQHFGTTRAQDELRSFVFICRLGNVPLSGHVSISATWADRGRRVALQLRVSRKGERPMGVTPPSEDDHRPRRAAWVPVIQSLIQGAVAIILKLISQGRHPF